MVSRDWTFLDQKIATRGGANSNPRLHNWSTVNALRDFRADFLNDCLSDAGNCDCRVCFSFGPTTAQNLKPVDGWTRTVRMRFSRCQDASRLDPLNLSEIVGPHNQPILPETEPTLAAEVTRILEHRSREYQCKRKRLAKQGVEISDKRDWRTYKYVPAVPLIYPTLRVFASDKDTQRTQEDHAKRGRTAIIIGCASIPLGCTSTTVNRYHIPTTAEYAYVAALITYVDERAAHKRGKPKPIKKDDLFSLGDGYLPNNRPEIKRNGQKLYRSGNENPHLS